MTKYILLLLLSKIALFSNTIDEIIKQRELFERQKEIFIEKELQKQDKIIHYDIEKPTKELSSGGKCFEINEIKEEGFSLLKKSEKEIVYGKYINRCNNLQDIKNLINEITSLYIAKGYITSKVYISSQNIGNKILTLKAVEGKIDSVNSKNSFTKNSFFLLEDDYLNLRELEVGIENFNRLNSNNAKIDIKPSDKASYSIVEIENERSFFINGNIFYNNFGSSPTGEHQPGLNLNFDNLLGINDVFSVNYNVTDRVNTQDNSIADIYSYSFPIGRLLYTLSYSKSKYKQVIPANFNNFYTRGKSENYTVDFNYKLFHNKSNKIGLGYFINYYKNENYINDVLIETSTYNLSKTGFKLNYLYQAPTFSFYATLQHIRGVTWFDDSNPTSLDEKYKIFLLDSYFSKDFDNFRYSLDFHLQRSSQQLFSVNQISIGGPYSVRGYKEDGLYGNTGYYYRNELGYSVNVLNQLGAMPYIAIDGGWIKEEEDSDGGRLLGSAIGLKLNYKSFYADIYYAKPIKKDDVIESENFFGVYASYRF